MTGYRGFGVVAAVLAILAPMHSAFAAGATRPRPSGPEELVRTTAGLVRGQVHEDHRLFQGIPYGAAPTGPLRWKPARKPESWTGVRDATRPGASCPQLPAVFGGVGSTTEDCLFLNVTTPRVGSNGPAKPVLVWIHGAGTIGSGDVFDASRLAAQGDVIVVTINYRMGIFGAFAHPELKDSGTIGLEDQRTALRWVRDNIDAFGGNPRNVTLFGVSFGATAAVAHTLSPRSRGLFDKAILHSAFPTQDAPDGAIYPFLGALPVYGWKPTAEATELGSQMAAAFGCHGAHQLDCLRGKSVEELLTYPQGMSIFQTYAYGNQELPGLPEDLLRAGRFAHVPILAGATKDEHRTFVAIRELLGYRIEDADYPAVLSQAFGDLADEVAAEYPLSEYPNARVAFASVMTDRMWALKTREYLDLYGAENRVYFYEFADEFPPPEFPFPEVLPSGAYHNSDISYLFRAPAFEAQLTAAQRELSDSMIAYWSSFAWSGKPTAAGQPEWPRYDTTGEVLSLAPGPGGIGPVDYAEEHKLAFWRSITGS
ncbi:carboxylesterase/lipase family protein [Dactylosporangium sp. CA-233914]|uniref:carboxylesterase/lipase family protein n=1 Tax=Dactylosporangium sp. CA-233914 TaxID=3239934 RepID=UPI003D92AFE4